MTFASCPNTMLTSSNILQKAWSFVYRTINQLLDCKFHPIFCSAYPFVTVNPNQATQWPHITQYMVVILPSIGPFSLESTSHKRRQINNINRQIYVVYQILSNFHVMFLHYIFVLSDSIYLKYANILHQTYILIWRNKRFWFTWNHMNVIRSKIKEL